MLKKRVIVTLLLKNGMCVKGQKFRDHRNVCSMEQAIRVADRRQIDELILLDIAERKFLNQWDNKSIEYCKDCFMPLTIGGKIVNNEMALRMIRMGADKISIGAEAVAYLDTIESISAVLGSQSVVVSIDSDDGRVVYQGASRRSRHKDVEFAKRVAGHGAGEILLTSIRHEGMMGGYDLRMIERVASAVSIPVVAHGGAGSYRHMFEAFEAGAHAVAAGAMFLFTDLTPTGARRYLADHGIPTRA